MGRSSRKRTRNAAAAAAEAEAEAEEIGLLPSQPNGTSQQVNAPTIPKTITDVSGSTSDPVKESGGAEAGEKGLLPSQLDGTFQPVKAPTATIRKRVRRFKRDEVSIIEEEDGGEEDDEEEDGGEEDDEEDDGGEEDDEEEDEDEEGLLQLYRKAYNLKEYSEEASLGSPVTDATVDVNQYVDTTKRVDDDIEIHEEFSGVSKKLQKSRPIQFPPKRRRSRASRFIASEFDSDHEETALSSVEPNPGIKRPTVTVLQPPPPPPTL